MNSQETTAGQESTTDSETTTVDAQETTTSQEQSTTPSEETTTSSGDTTTTQTESTSTTQQETTTTSTSEESTQSTGSSDCPPVEEGQGLFVCPTGFRRHPQNCNMFYQCTQQPNSYNYNIVSFSCPNDTVYYSERTQCLPPQNGDQCSGQTRSLKNINDEINTIKIRSSKSLCSNEGHFPFEDDYCNSMFIKCTHDSTGNKLEPTMYKCPRGYSYWRVSRRCEKTEKITNCSARRYDESNGVPVEWINLGTARRRRMQF
jgi:hypothetical protein